MVDVAEIERISEVALRAVGYELLALDFCRERQGWVLRVFIDHPQQGPADRETKPRRITHGDCGTASRHLGTVLDVEDLIDAPYALEVSSPGVLRPLRKVRDYRRFIGFQVRVTLRRPLEGRKNFSGELQAVADDRITVVVDGQEHVLPLELIRKARLNEEY